MVHRLRPRNIEHRDRHEGLDYLLHGVPLYPLAATLRRAPPRTTELWLEREESRRISPCTATRSPPPPALAILCPREVWCVNLARAMANDCRSCLKAARSRRPLRRYAALARSTSTRRRPLEVVSRGDTKDRSTLRGNGLVLSLLLLLLFMSRVFEVTVYVHKSLRFNWQCVPDNLESDSKVVPAAPAPVSVTGAPKNLGHLIVRFPSASSHNRAES